MKITKSQLKKMINEVMGMADHPSQVDDAEYDRGYQDGLDGYPPADDATLDYDAGYDDGKRDAGLPGNNLQEGYEYDPVSEMYDILQHLSDAEMKLSEIVKHYDAVDPNNRVAMQMDNLSRQVKKIHDILETHVK
tara:strand:+ start:1229 stop:1633 length:405 start_codon:yes stop_codon:yes gene_type:complete